MLNIQITPNPTLSPKPTGALGFGRIFTDHMFLMDYTDGIGWHDPRIVPYGPLTLDPSAQVFHYGQEAFEGMKAYKNASGEVYLFRPQMNARRSNLTNDRLCIPQIPEDDFVQAITTLVRLDADWVPSAPGTSLYIRPFIIATERFLGVAPSKTYLFCIIISPSEMYYTSTLSAVSIRVEDNYVRAVKGGVGFAKTGGNYAASLAGQKRANAEGCAQVLWLDGVERKYIEEVGSMNIFFKIKGKLVTPALNGSILPGITRDSVITLCKDWGYEVEERPISIDELVAHQQSGALEEVFGTGTAAVITPVGKLCYQGETLTINSGETGPLSKQLYDTLTAIQRGECEDPYGWRVNV